MSDDLPQQSPAEPNKVSDVLREAETESASRIAWCHQRIADHGYQVRPPPKIWSGRDQLAKSATEVFGLNEIDALNLVDLAVAELFDRSDGDQRHVDKRLMLMRLADIRTLVRRAIRDGRKESTFQYNVNPKDPNTLIEKKVKEKRIEGIDMSAVGRLIEIEQFEASLKNLLNEEGAGTDDPMTMFEQLGKAVSVRAGSPAQRLRELPVDQMPVAGQMQIIAAITQVNKKRVKSQQIKPPEE